MAKRKAGGPLKAPEAQAENPSKRTRLNVDSYVDVAGSDDEFHINRDKVLLDEGPDAKRQRQWDEKDEFLDQSDEEVLAESDELDASDEADETTQTGRSNARGKPNGTLDPDSEDVESGDEEDNLGTWGNSKKDYYGADDMETEQDALDEEAEARRIQQKQLQGMTAADYGFDESEWKDVDSKKDSAAAKSKKPAVVTEILPQLQISESMSTAERLKMLKSQYPEFEPLSKDYLDVQERLKELSIQAQHSAEQSHQYRKVSTPVAVTKHRAAAAYSAVLAMYFTLLTSTAGDEGKSNIAMSANTLRDHPVMDSMLKTRKVWLKVKDLETESVDEDEGLEDDTEVADDIDGMDDILSAGTFLVQPKPKKRRKNKAQKAADAARADAEARRLDRIRRTEADLAGLDDLLVQKPAVSKTIKSQRAKNDGDDSDLGEETELTAQELAEKARKKKSLRFYTSQIAQKANKRGAAGRNAGGDDDVPYRERLRDRQDRLMAEAANRGKKKTSAGEELGGESDEEDYRQAREARGEAGGAGGEDDEGYYDMVAAKSAKKKSDKAALAEAHRLAALQGGQVIAEEVVGADGRREISYQIEKNRGLNAKSGKKNEISRVKKRKRYDDKKKKLASMKPVFKAAAASKGRSSYGGEMSGIKSGLVRSRKL